MTSKEKPVQKSATDEPITFVQCTECGNEQADMGKNVVCEACDSPLLEPIAPTVVRDHERRHP